MIKNNLVLAYRNLIRQRGYSFLNITGMAVGLACAFLIVFWIRDEVRFDRFHENQDRLYRVMRNVYSGENIQTRDVVTWNIAGVLKEEYPEVESVAITSRPEDLVVNHHDLPVREQGIYATAEFFEVLSWRIILGERSNMLTDPASIVISGTFAEKHFGPQWRRTALGGTIKHEMEDVGDFTVTGVFDNLPRQSSLQFDFVLSMELFRAQNKNWLFDWNNSGIQIYALLHEGADGVLLNDKITDIQNKHITTFRSDLFLQHYADQHLYSSFRDGVQAGGRIEYVRIFLAAAVMIVLIACINFMNLSTARSMRRAREIGIRKASGAGRGSLFGQFMGESLLLVSMALCLSIVLALAALPAFRDLTAKDVSLSELGSTMVWVFSGIGIVTAILSGIYPALYLSSFNPVRVLRGTFRVTSGNENIRKGLVVFQFLMSTLLIVGTITIFRQMQYIHSKNLGLDRENVIYLPLKGALKEHYAVLKDELSSDPSITVISSASENPLDIGSNTHQVSWREKDPDSQLSMRILAVNFDFLETMKMELADGRDFDPRYGTDSVSLIINQKALEVMGFDDPIGERLSFWGNTGAIVGVVKDFHMTSMNAEIKPTIILLKPQWSGWLFARTAPGQAREALKHMEVACTRINPSYPFEYYFLDETFEKMYQSELVSGKLSGIFSGIAILISCLGLFGLASYMAERRTREIGIRKVLGATVPHIVGLLNGDFLKLVLSGMVMAIPLGGYMMGRWLENFAYRVEVGWVEFLTTAIVILVMATATVSWQSVRSAMMNSVESLASE